MSRRKKKNPDQNNNTAAPDSGAAWSDRRTSIALGAVLLFSLVLGLLCLYQFRTHPSFNHPILDEESYVSWAKDIAAGRVMGGGVFYQDPLYPYFLALVFWVTQSLLVVRLIQVALGTAGVWLVFITGKKLMGERGGLIAALIFALCHGLYFFELLILKATLVVFLSAAVCALGVMAVEKPGARWRWAGIGVLLGLLTLLRGNFQALLPFVIGWALISVKADALKGRFVKAGLVAAGIVVVLAPVGIRNYRVGGGFVLTTSQGGANFYIGNNELADGLYKVLPFVRPEPRWEAHDFKAEAERRAGRSLTPSQVSGFWYNEAWKWIKNNPGDWAILFLHKARLMVHDYEIPDNHSFKLTRDYFVPLLRIAPLGFGWMWGLALIGAWVMARADRKAWLPVLFAFLYAGSIIPFFIVDRYRVAMVPAMAVLAAGGVSWSLEKWRAREVRAVAAAAAIIMVTLLISFLPTRESTWPQPYSAYNIGNAYFDIHQPAKAIFWYDKALETLPHDQDILANRAEAERMLDSMGQKK